MSSPSLRRAVTIAFVLGLALAMPFASVSASAGGPPHVQNPLSMPMKPLTPAQIKALQAHQQKASNKVIVIMKDQVMSETGRAHKLAVTRAATIRTEQKPVLSELHQVGATNVKAFTLINAIAAKVSLAEVRYLRAQPGVRGVVADKTLSLPQVYHASRVQVSHQVKAMARSAQVRKATGSCNSNHPLLEPEAVSQIHAQSSSGPNANMLANGAGVNVAIMADGIDFSNPDFIRPNGVPAFTDIEDFTGSGGIFAGGNSEGDLDASSIGAQGNERYFVGQFTNFLDPAYNANSTCPVIKVVGVAPGANMMDIQIFGDFTTSSSFVQGIQYAVAHGANVINQSFGGNPYPDQSIDPTSLADEAAIADGVVIVSSTGDAGVNGSQGTPSTVPGVIAVGASTSFQIYKQLGEEAFSLSNGKYVDDGVSTLSSGGPNYEGTKGVDVMAPGDLNWDIASDYSGNTDFNGFPAGVTEEGGTSESSPLVAGVAALVIQKYRKTHHGHSPSPAVVKDIIVSSATDLHLPSQIQGAGLVNALKAVQEAASWGRPVSKHIGQSLAINSNNCVASVQCNTALSFAGQPGTHHNFSVSVKNTGMDPEKVKVASRTLSATGTHSGTVTLTPSSDPFFYDPSGFQRSYQETTTPVAAGTKVLEVSVGWNNAAQPGKLVRLALLDPTGAYACYSLPQGSGNGFGRCTVHDPKAGTWKIVIFTRGNDSPGAGYAGTVNWTASSSKYVSAGSVSPSSATIMPNSSKTFTYKAVVPMTSGDATNDVVVTGKVGGKVKNASTIPVILRSMIATSLGSGGSYSGILTGGDARPGAGNQQEYQFNVPAGANNLAVSLALAGVTTQTDVQAELINPAGLPIDTQSNITGFDGGGNPDSFQNNLQFFRNSPAAGTWTLQILLDFYSGPVTSTTFTGTIAFNTVNTSNTLPDSSAINITQGSPYTATVSVTNTGTTEETYYLDPRLDTTSPYIMGSGDNGGFPTNGLEFPVPPATSQIAVAATNNTSSTPLNAELLYEGGSAPVGFEGNPDYYVAAPGGGGVVNLNASAAELPFGFWESLVDDINCQAMFECDSGTTANFDDISQIDTVTTATFDPDVTTDTGDFWAFYAGVTGSFDYNPLDLMPGQSGTINVTITPSQTVGNVVSGHILVNTLQVAGSSFATNASGDEVASLPYQYTVS